MENLQRVLFLILSTLIIVVVFTTFGSTEIDISSDESMRMPNQEEGFFVYDKTPLHPIVEKEEVAEIEWCYVDDAAEKKQEIVTEVKTEQSMATSEWEIYMLGQIIQVEAGGIQSDTEKACVAWTVLNHVDHPAYPNSISACITQPGAFAYISGTYVTDHNLWLARDVVSRWEREKAGETNVGRTLPQGYLSFWGDGSHNYFRVNYNTYDRWDYSLGSPYET